MEARVEIANRRGPDFYVIDRQVQIPGVRGRLDVLGIAPALDVPGHVLIALEIKNALDNRIQTAGAQVCRYVEALTERTGYATAAIFRLVGEGAQATASAGSRRAGSGLDQEPDAPRRRDLARELQLAFETAQSSAICRDSVSGDVGTRPRILTFHYRPRSGGPDCPADRGARVWALFISQLFTGRAGSAWT